MTKRADDLRHFYNDLSPSDSERYAVRMSDQDVKDWVRLLELASWRSGRNANEIRSPQKFCASLMRKYNSPKEANLDWWSPTPGQEELTPLKPPAPLAPGDRRQEYDKEFLVSPRTQVDIVEQIAALSEKQRAFIQQCKDRIKRRDEPVSEEEPPDPSG